MDTKRYKKNDDNYEQIKKIYAALFYDAPDAIVMIDKNQCVMDINKKFKKLFGYKLEDIKGKDLDDLITKKDVLSEAKKISENLKNGKKENIESVRYDSKGNAIEVNIKVSPIFIDNEIAGGYGIYADISKKKSAERELLNQNSKLNVLLKNSTDAIAMVDSDDRITNINSNFTKLFGYKFKDIRGKKINSIIGKEDILGEMGKRSKTALSGEKINYESFRYNSKGEQIEVLIKGIPIFDGDEVIGAYAIYSDISERKSVERQSLEQIKKLEALFMNPVDAIVMTDEDSNIININSTFTKLFGYKLKDIKGKNIDELLSDKNCIKEARKLTKDSIKESGITIETIRYGKDGKKKDVKITGMPIIVNGEVIGGYGMYTDISRRKQIEREFTDQSFRFKSLFMNSNNAIAMFDKNHNIININNRFTELFGYKVKEVKGKNLDSIVARENVFKEAKELTENLLNGNKVNLETIRYGKDGKGIDVLAKGVPIIIDGEVIGGYGIYTDISDKKRAECEILQKNLKLKSLFENATDAIAMLDAEDFIVNINSKFTELFGYKFEEVIGEKINSLICDKVGIKEIREISKEVFGGKELKMETTRFAKDGKKIEVLLTGIPIIENNEVVGAYALYSDISKNKISEREMLKQNSIFKALFMNSVDAIARIDEKFNIVDINNKFIELFGYPLEEIKGKNIDAVIANKSIMDKAKEISKKLSKGIQETVETVRFGKNGKKIEVLVRGVPIIDNDKVIGGYVIYTDISLRKSIEREILYMSYHDELTGLYNRRFFEAELKRLDTIRNYPLSIVYADVNGLKNINDSYGHAKGDSLLKKAAKIIKREFRSDDIIARIGGDEFVVVIPRTEVADVEKIVDRVNEVCAETFIGSIPISISFGVDSKTKPEQDILDTIKNAEDEMYNNKLIEKFNGE